MSKRIKTRVQHVREARKYLHRAGLTEGSYEWRTAFRAYLDSVGIPAPGHRKQVSEGKE